MNIRYIINAVRRFGIKGIIDYFLRKPKERLFLSHLKSTLRSEAPERGVTLIACFDFPGSLSKVMRDLAISLKNAGVPYQTLNIPCSKPIPKHETEPFLTPQEEFCANRFTHIVTIRSPIPSPDKRCSVHNIEFWEFEDGFIQNCPEVLRSQNVLALSDFNGAVFRNLLPTSIDVRKIQYPFQFEHGELTPRELTREKYKIGVDDFVVFFNFDYSSSYFRKNPEGILKAFAKALADKPNAKLVLKTMRAQKCKLMSNRLFTLSEELGLNEQLITIDNFIPQEDLVNLTNACDVYISLHRGEGFGLGIAEAMSLGKPVIVTNYSATTEFCNSENSILIPYTMVKIMPEQLDNDAYKYVSSWAEPDVCAAADAILRLYNNIELRKKLGEKASKDIRNQFSTCNFSESIRAFLNCAPHQICQ